MEFIFLLLFLDVKQTYNHYNPPPPIHIEVTQKKLMWNDLIERKEARKSWQTKPLR